MQRKELSLKWLWCAEFADGHVISQPADDRYSKHDGTAIHNPSSFRDIQDYAAEFDTHVKKFSLGVLYHVDLDDGTLELNGVKVSLEKPGDALTNRSLIYYRTRTIDLISGDQSIQSYTFGYKGTDRRGHVVERTVTLK